ncbi:helix-turn-helix transcriptional regulator [Opitutus sp. ER46]|uniref:helix-turn-helix transcriptional regulator n=1 Tax=Opitutus sp. ER46 TaxID=2161864 RepID=UPI000D31174A|nr:helix-turn-helix transcriptional regulator [Opitutus sp. ER46]PTX99072.1 AraC family transcriptional regulator [Opitutus sp. ER46]
MRRRPITRPEEVIVTALKRARERLQVKAVHFAETGATTPPALAYFVHFPRLYLALGGTDAMWIEQAGHARLVRLAAGHAVVVPANCWNRPVTTAPCRALNVLFGRHQIGLSLVTHDAAGHPQVAKAVLQGAIEEAPRNIMHALLALRGTGGDAAPPLVDALLRATLHALTAAAPEPRRRTANLYESICMYVQEHFQSPLTRDAVAQHFNISPPHVSRLFKREGMVSFNAYVTYVRLNWAKYLLRHHHQTVDEVAARCGFSEAAYFCRVFKQRTRMTPSDYRHSAPVAPSGPAAAH